MQRVAGNERLAIASLRSCPACGACNPRRISTRGVSTVERVAKNRHSGGGAVKSHLVRPAVQRRRQHQAQGLARSTWRIPRCRRPTSPIRPTHRCAFHTHRTRVCLFRICYAGLVRLRRAWPRHPSPRPKHHPQPRGGLQRAGLSTLTHPPDSPHSLAVHHRNRGVDRLLLPTQWPPRAQGDV
eukprot:scaffold14363_cov111-Isochrysis_galbana.AAC.4